MNMAYGKGCYLRREDGYNGSNEIIGRHHPASSQELVVKVTG
jgi:hypothetical protein